MLGFLEPMTWHEFFSLHLEVTLSLFSLLDVLKLISAAETLPSHNPLANAPEITNLSEVINAIKRSKIILLLVRLFSLASDLKIFKTKNSLHSSFSTSEWKLSIFINIIMIINNNNNNYYYYYYNIIIKLAFNYSLLVCSIFPP